MTLRKTFVALLVGLTAWSCLPETSQAQFFGRGRGGWGSGYGYGNYGYGRGVSPGYYGSGWGYGAPYSNFGYGAGYYNSGPGTFYNQPYVNSQPYVANQPFVSGSGTTNQSNYPPTNTTGQMQPSMTNDPCCCAGGPGVAQAGYYQNQAGFTTQNQGGFAQSQGGTHGGALVVVNLPPNAELIWNGTRTNVQGPSRQFTAQPSNEGAKEKLEARWMGQDGKMVTQTREIQVRPNETMTVDFNSTDDQNNSTNSNINNGSNLNNNTPNINNNTPNSNGRIDTDNPNGRKGNGN